MHVIYWEETVTDTRSPDSMVHAIMPPKDQKNIEIRNAGSYHVPFYLSYEVQYAGGAVTYKQVAGEVSSYGN